MVATSNFVAVTILGPMKTTLPPKQGRPPHVFMGEPRLQPVAGKPSDCSAACHCAGASVRQLYVSTGATVTLHALLLEPVTHIIDSI